MPRDGEIAITSKFTSTQADSNLLQSTKKRLQYTKKRF